MKSDCPKFERTIHSQSSQPTENAQSQVCFGRPSIPAPLTSARITSDAPT